MDEKYYGFFKELNKWTFHEILDIDNFSNQDDFDFIIKKSSDLPKERIGFGPINHRMFYNFYNTDLTRKVITIGNWSLPSQLQTHSSFNPTYLSFFITDKFGEKISKTIKTFRISNFLEVLDYLEEMQVYYSVSHYNTLNDNENLREVIKDFENEVASLIKKNKKLEKKLKKLEKDLNS